MDELTSEWVSIAAVAERLKRDRSCLRRVLIKRGIPMKKGRRMTDSGFQVCCLIHKDAALAFIAEYETAKTVTREIEAAILGGGCG